MQLQQIISKFVMLAMLFTVISSTVNAGTIHWITSPADTDCRVTATMICCDNTTLFSQEHSKMCGSDAMDSHTSSPSCCIDNDCHANNVQFAILSNVLPISVPSATQVFTEPVGKRQYFYDVILRPPVFA